MEIRATAMDNKKCMEILDKIRVFFREYGSKYYVLYTIVYGSLAKCRITKLSDIDICVKIDSSADKMDKIEILAKLASDIEEYIGIKVDVVNIDTVELPLKYTVFREGIPVYVYSREKFVEDKW